jgi:hypothetical protein
MQLSHVTRPLELLIFLNVTGHTGQIAKIKYAKKRLKIEYSLTQKWVEMHAGNPLYPLRDSDQVLPLVV